MTARRMRQRLADGGDAPGAQYEADLKLSGRKDGEERSHVSQFKQRAQDEALGRQIREMGRRQTGQLTLNWDLAQAFCRVVTVEGSSDHWRRADRDSYADKPHTALAAVLADLLDPLEVAG